MSKAAELFLQRSQVSQPSQQSQMKELAQLLPGARVLIIRLRSLGDTVLMTPALRLLHGWRPDLRVSVLLEHPWDELLEGNPAVHSVMVLRGKMGTAWRVRRSRFAAVINLHGGPTSAFLTRLSGARWRAGFDHFRDATAYNLLVPSAQRILSREGPVHTTEHIASCLFWLGVPPGEIPPAEVYPSPESIAGVQAKLQSIGLERGAGYAVIHPVALYASKQWTPQGFAEIGELLEREFGLRPVYICGQGESALLDRIELFARHPILRASGWPLRDLVALLAGARVFAGNDSGPAHIAAAARIPVLVIFGSSHAAVWKPWKAVNAAVVQNDFDCNPCPGDRCAVYDEPRCILSISTEQVRVSLEALLRSRVSTRA